MTIDYNRLHAMTTDYIRLHAMTKLITIAMTTLMTAAITRDDKIDDNSDDNISLPGIAGYVLSDTRVQTKQRAQST